MFNNKMKDLTEIYFAWNKDINGIRNNFKINKDNLINKNNLC